MFEIEVRKHELHQVLRKAGITQVAAAKFCGTSLSSITQYLNGYRPAPAWLEAKLALLRDEIERRKAQAPGNGR